MRRTHFYGWHLVFVLWVIYFINISFPMYGGAVINSYMVSSLNINRSILGLGVMVFSLSNGLLAALIAWSINKLGIRITLFTGSVLIVIGSLMMGFVVKNAVGYILVYGCIIGLGVGFGAALPIRSGITYWFKRKRSLAMSIVLTAGGIGGYVATSVTNRIIHSNGNWQAAWMIIAGITMVSAIASLLFVKDKPEDLNQVQDGITEEESQEINITKSQVYYTDTEWIVKDVVRTSSFWLMTFGALGLVIPYFICMAHGVINLMDKSVPTHIAATSMGLIALFSILGRLISGITGDKFEPRFTYSIGLSLLAAGCLLAIFANSTFIVYLYAICIGTGFGLSYVCTSVIYGNYYGPIVFASLMAIVSPMVAVVGGSAPLLAGVVFDIYGNYNMAFAVAGTISIIGSVGLLFAKPPQNNPAKNK